MKNWVKITFVALLALFIFFRLGPILNRTLPYTYDQGRDFIKADEQVTNMRPTFIGPTTGIDGLFHGAWWYYLLIIPRIIFNGSPIGFYYFMLAIALSANILFFLFLRKKLNDLAALLFLAIVAVSPYFIPMGFTPSNNIIVPTVILALISLVFCLFEKKNTRLTYLGLGLALSFVFEFEVAFGLFMIPAFIATSLLFREVRIKLYNLKNLPFLLAGLVIPVLPRALFELKNNFLQSKTILEFFIKPKLHNPKPFMMVLNDRINLFIDYGKGIFFDRSVVLAAAVLMFTIVAFFLFRKSNKMAPVTKFLTTLVGFLFAISLYYKDNFWFNYYEGIQYIFLTLFLIAFYLLTRKRQFYSMLILGFFMVLAFFGMFRDLKKPAPDKLIGLAEAEKTMDYVLSQVGKNDYCLRIYTPPVIPHTYVYLMNYQSRVNGYKISKFDFTNKTCYFIVESDNFDFRVKQWREGNEPHDGALVKKEVISGNVTVEKWDVR